MHIRTLNLPWQRVTGTEKAVGWGALGVCIVASSTSVTFAAALTRVLSPLSMLFISEALTLLFTVLSFGVLPILAKILRLKRAYWMPLLFVGICNSVIAPLLAFTGLTMTGPINAELFIRAEDLFLVLLAVMLLGERLGPRHVIGAGLVLLGVVIVTLRGFTDQLHLGNGDGLILLAAMCYALGGIVFKKYLSSMEPELVLFSRSCTALSIFFVASPFLNHTLVEELAMIGPELLIALIGYGFVARFLHLFSFYEAVERLPVRSVSLLLNLGIIGSMAFARIYLGTTIEWFHLAGAGLILMGSVVMELPSHKKEARLEQHLKHKHRSHV